VADWFASNAGWFGPSVAVILAVIGWVIQAKLRRSSGRATVRQRQKGGHASTNLQVGGDARIHPRQGDDV
jgi:hypothetical protein